LVGVSISALAAQEIADKTFCVCDERHSVASLVAEGFDGVDLGGAVGWDIAGDRGGN